MTTQVNDRPAERGINITNALLAVLLLVSSAFGSVIITSMGNMEKAINSLNVSTGQTSIEMKHIHERLAICAKTHKGIKQLQNNHETRITILENK